MDAADLLVIDCSQVGGDNARLFGAMCISRYYVDAIGRQGTPRDQRRQHFLIVDEVPTFDTEALRRILDEGRKFGLALVVASQSLRGLGERLRDSVLTNAGVIALISPGPDDVSAVRRLFDPMTPDDLLGCNCTRCVVRMPGRRWPARRLWRHGPPAAGGRSRSRGRRSSPEAMPGTVAIPLPSTTRSGAGQVASGRAAARGQAGEGSERRTGRWVRRRGWRRSGTGLV